MHMRTGTDLNCVTEAHGCLGAAHWCLYCVLFKPATGKWEPQTLKVFMEWFTFFFFFIPPNTNVCFPLTKSVTLESIKVKLTCAFFLHFPIFFWQTRILYHFSIVFFLISLKLTLFSKDSVKTSMATFERLKVETNLTLLTSSVS